jgi:isopentenyl diphosphate isomerase/L-lactate dehydrogenase-like FMN-dependent dehydrogenase
VTIASLEEYEQAAAAALPKSHFDFIAGGAEDEVTRRENRLGFRRLHLRPRVLTGQKSIETATNVLGTPILLPVLLAPAGLQTIAHPDGELASARAAATAGSIAVVSVTSSYSLEEIARASNAPKWFQLYCYEDPNTTLSLVQRAEAAGYAALCVTVDTPRLGRRDADIRNRFRLPDGVYPANFLPQPTDDIRSDQREAAIAAGRFDRRLGWQDIERLRSQTKLPIILKGIMTSDDATLAVQHGASAIIVSNHGGRHLDSTAATIDVLRVIVDAVGDKAEVLLDGGIRRGTDVLKALALGARAVLIAQPYLFALAVEGQSGIERVLEILKTELELAMTFCGCEATTAVPADLLFRTATSTIADIGAGTPAVNTPDHMRRVVQAHVDAENEKDVAGVVATYGRENPILEDIPRALRYEGIDSIMHNYRSIWDDLPGLVRTVSNWTIGADEVVIELTLLGGTEPTPPRTIARFTFDEEGRIKQETTYYDVLTMTRHFGTAPGGRQEESTG